MTATPSGPFSDELQQLFDADQDDRRTEHQDCQPRDRRRQARAREIIDAGGLHVARDFYHAAMIFQHGADSSDHALACVLADTAADLGDRRAGWLAAAARDRCLMSLGLPQLYGTQFVMPVDQEYCLYEVHPGIRDEQRIDHQVPPLAEALAKVGGRIIGRSELRRRG